MGAEAPPALTGADVHWFSYQDRDYCLDVNSSVVFSIDRAGAAALWALHDPGGGGSLAGGVTPMESTGAASAIAELRANGFFAGNTKRARLVALPERTRVDLLGLSLFVMGDCNLACRYCFNSGGTQPADEPRRMPTTVADRAVDLLLAHGSGSVGIDFFGGEPLLNFPMIEHVVAYASASGRDVQYSLITNGTVLGDGILEFLGAHRFHVVVSYDGHLQDLYRPARNGQPLRDTIRANVRRLARVLPREDISVRCIATHALHDLAPLAAEAEELGVRLLFGPVTLPPTDPLAVTADDLAALCRAQERVLWGSLHARRIDSLTGVTSAVNTILRAMTGRQRYYSCGLGKDILGVSARGDLYPCHRFIGVPGFKMGTVFDGVDREAYRRWADRYVDNRGPCTACWARYFCGGGCAHEGWIHAGDAEQVVESRCDLIRFETELGLKLYVAAFEEYPEQLDQLATMVEVRQFDNLRSTKEVVHEDATRQGLGVPEALHAGP